MQIYTKWNQGLSKQAKPSVLFERKRWQCTSLFVSSTLSCLRSRFIALARDLLPRHTLRRLTLSYRKRKDQLWGKQSKMVEEVNHSEIDSEQFALSLKKLMNLMWQSETLRVSSPWGLSLYLLFLRWFGAESGAGKLVFTSSISSRNTRILIHFVLPPQQLSFKEKKNAWTRKLTRVEIEPGLTLSHIELLRARRCGYFTHALRASPISLRPSSSLEPLNNQGTEWGEPVKFLYLSDLKVFAHDIPIVLENLFRLHESYSKHFMWREHRCVLSRSSHFE